MRLMITNPTSSVKRLWFMVSPDVEKKMVNTLLAMNFDFWYGFVVPLLPFLWRF